MNVMRRTTWFRFLSAFVAFWVPLTVGEPSALRLCGAHHGGPTPVAAKADANVDAHHAHLAGVTTTADDSGADHHAPAGEKHHCTCIAGCSTSAVNVAVLDAPVTAVIVVSHELSGYSPTAPERARPGPEFARPHTTGPPSLA